MISFKGAHFPKDVILYAVFFYVRYGVSYRDLEEIMEESRLISIVNCRRLGSIEFNKEIQKLVALLSKTDCPPSTTLSDSARVVDAEHPSIFGLG